MVIRLGFGRNTKCFVYFYPRASSSLGSKYYFVVVVVLVVLVLVLVLRKLPQGCK